MRADSTGCSLVSTGSFNTVGHWSTSCCAWGAQQAGGKQQRATGKVNAKNHGASIAHHLKACHLHNNFNEQGCKGPRLLTKPGLLARLASSSCCRAQPPPWAATETTARAGGKTCKEALTSPSSLVV